MSMLGMMSPKMIAGMLSGFITDENIQKLNKGLTDYIVKKQAEHGPAAQFKLVIEPTADNTTVLILLWLTFTNGTDPELIFKQELSTLTEVQVKTLIAQYAG